jgi:MoaA/NifB/PqqE/SkfB family radical SAM enzyme
VEIPSGPSDVIWDITYACPLRCTHCYSESGRRPSRQLGTEDLLRVADALIEWRPNGVAFAGGEPLLVRDVFQVAERLSRAGIPVTLYTGGWPLTAAMADDILRVFAQVNVSVDGATADVHDRIRGRSGSFDRAMATLTALNDAARRRESQGDAVPAIGIDCVLVRSNFHQIDDVCTELAPRFPALRFLWFGAAVPSGLASRSGFADHELLTDPQHRQLGSREQMQRIRALAPRHVAVATNDNLMLQMHPDLVARGVYMPTLQVEPDGEVRAMPIYEGTVGNVLTDPGDVLWKRAVDRWHDPFVVETLQPVRTMAQWAQAARRIDYHFGSDAVRERIDRRPVFALS